MCPLRWRSVWSLCRTARRLRLCCSIRKTSASWITMASLFKSWICFIYGSVDGTCIISALKLSSVETVLTEKAQSESYVVHHTPSFKSGMEKESAALLHVRQLEKDTAEGVKKSERKVKDGTSVLLGEVTRNKNTRTLPTQVKDRSLPQKECRVLVKRLDMPVSLQSRPVRRNRGLKMKMILLQEKRRLYGGERPAHKTMSTLKTATSERYTQTKTSQSSAKASSGAPVEGFDVEDSITTYKDLTNLAPVSNSSEDDSLSNCSDEDPSNMASVHDEDFTVLDKAQGTSDIKPAAARKTHSATRRGRCCICKEQVQANMNAHMKTHFPNGDYEAQTLFKCNECEKAFRKVLRDPETLARHKASHTPFQCTLCEENFRLYKPLARHYENVHKLSRPFKCNHCPKSFSKLRYFIGHEWKHTGRLPFQCAQCHMRFKHDADLVSHLRVHTREKPFLCADCGKAFSCRSNLRRHLNFLHSQSRDERRYSCSLFSPACVN
uniref:C2H2-type domain-containing protein n=1 Tax=Myripristis murdjan TaxID=586833 RepID=A0A668AKZ8_9TELE